MVYAIRDREIAPFFVLYIYLETKIIMTDFPVVTSSEKLGGLFNICSYKFHVSFFQCSMSQGKDNGDSLSDFIARMLRRLHLAI